MPAWMGKEDVPEITLKLPKVQESVLGQGQVLQVKVCTNCGSDYAPARARRSDRYCSLECRKKANGILVTSTVCTGTTGAISELAVSAYLMERGAAVFRALSPACKFDLVASYGGNLVGIECRTGAKTASGRISYPSDHQGADMIAVRVREELHVFFFAVTDSGREFLDSYGLADYAVDTKHARRS